jgi:hypothetical protein
MKISDVEFAGVPIIQEITWEGLMTKASGKPAVIMVLSLIIFVLAACGSQKKAEQADKGPAQARPSARVLTNQVGYEPLGSKKAVVQGYAGDSFATFTVKRYPGGEVVFEGTPVHVGPVAKWKDWDFWTIDWSAVKEEGTYVIECVPKAAPPPGRRLPWAPSVPIPFSSRRTPSPETRSRT